MLRRVPFAAALAAAPLALAAPAAAGEPTLTLSEVRPGLTCEASSVVQGTEPVNFGAEVISVEGGPRPADAIIVMRFSGDAIAATGIGQGFSGSPVRCQDGAGVWRVIGAISLGIGQYDNFVAGVTPIEAMLATPTMGSAPAIPKLGDAPAASRKAKAKAKVKAKVKAKAKAKTSAKAASTKSSSATTKQRSGSKPEPISYAEAWRTGKPLLTMRGPRGPLATRIERAAAQAGIPLAVAPSATRLQAPASVGLKPGDAVAATLATGDLQLGAVGTVTYVDGDRVWAFGHPFAGSGPSRMLMERAQISTVIASPAIGPQVSFKLGSAIAPAGTIGFDGTAAVGGVLGPTPSTIPLRATIRGGDGAVLRSATTNLVDERAVRGGSAAAYLALASGANAAIALQRLTAQDVVGGAARTCVKVSLKGESKPLYQCIDAAVPNPSADGGIESAVLQATMGAVSPAMSAERFMRLIDAVDVDVTYRAEADSATIVRVRQPRNVRAGSLITVRAVVVQGSTGERREIPLRLRVPRAAAGQRTAIVVMGSGLGSMMASGSGVLEILLGGEGGEGGAPKNLPALRSLYTRDGISGLRAAAVPGISGPQFLSLLEEDDGALSDEEYDAIMDSVKLRQELPTVTLEGAAAVTVRPRR